MAEHHYLCARGGSCLRVAASAGACLAASGQVNVWILLLLIPLQILCYYAAGAMIFSYLKEKYDITISGAQTAQMALELNFVNHILPSGGVSARRI